MLNIWDTGKRYFAIEGVGVHLAICLVSDAPNWALRFLWGTRKSSTHRFLQFGVTRGLEYCGRRRRICLRLWSGGIGDFNWCTQRA